MVTFLDNSFRHICYNYTNSLSYSNIALSDYVSENIISSEEQKERVSTSTLTPLLECLSSAGGGATARGGAVMDGVSTAAGGGRRAVDFYNKHGSSCFKLYSTIYHD
ncbi:hypothetical protein EVAR_19549_1 [Eumeta japonica]|uniref:Uncharacterized protein n=1 Tax=Eumeta variegata TaxID=151549 RepID=A0A4C1UFF0_EUMVA|nr:hypothetical protein EVAR_19549_1 [Eumeta japonica]